MRPRDLKIALSNLQSLHFTLVNSIYNNLEIKLETGIKLKPVINHSKEYVSIPKDLGVKIWHHIKPLSGLKPFTGKVLSGTVRRS